MRVVFMGTPDFAVASLDALIAANHEVTLAVTQPDRPKGRGRQLAFPAVKSRALELGIAVEQPASVRDEAFLELLRAASPEVIVVVAYGRILPDAVLRLPKYGCVNVHGSLLPAYRGAAPIQRAVFDGCAESGVTIMQMDAGMDTGDILMQAALPITEADTSGTMFDKLAVLGGKLLVETLARMENGTITPRRQDEAQASYAARLSKEDEIVDWSRPAEKIACQIRALAPAPGAYTLWNGQRLKLWQGRALEDAADALPGTVLSCGEALLVQTGAGVLSVAEVQPAGKKRMTARDFCNGAGIAPGSRFGGTEG